MVVRSALSVAAIHLSAILLSISTPCFSESSDVDCSVEFNLVSDIDGVVTGASITALERPHGTAISTSPTGLVHAVSVPLPNSLYRKIEVTAKHANSSAKTEIGDMAYFVQWPCVEVGKTSITLSSRTGSAKEVRVMWDSKDLLKPTDFASAAQQYSQALGTAEMRLAQRPNSHHQYDLIASYLALRAFNNLVRVSAIPIAHTARLEKIAIWHRTLLANVKRDGLKQIFDEGQEIASDRLALSAMYHKYWNKANSLADPAKAFEALARFRDALDAEPESDEILVSIGLSRSEIMASLNSYAGALARKRDEVPMEISESVKKQIQLTRDLLAQKAVSNRTKLKSDVVYLVKKFEF